MELDRRLKKFEVGKIPNNLYARFREEQVRSCHDVIICLPSENKILLAIRQGEPAKGFLWPFGGGRKRGFPLKYSLAKLIEKESNVKLSKIEQFAFPVDHFWEENAEFPEGTHCEVNYFTAIGEGEIKHDELNKTRLISPEEYFQERDNLAHWTRVGMDEALERFFEIIVKDKTQAPDYYINDEPLLL